MYKFLANKNIGMYIGSHGLLFLASSNLKYFGFFHNNKFYLYRERTFITEVELKGLDLKVISLSDRGELLVLQNNLLMLYKLSERNEFQPVELNSYFKEGGKLTDFLLIPNNKIFFMRVNEDKSIFAKLAKKDLFIQELTILNLNSKREEVILTKKANRYDDFYLFKISPFGNHILVADPENMAIQLINLLNYSEELSFSIDNVEIIDFFVNNQGDCAFILKEEQKKGIYFVGINGTKNIIKTEINIEDFTIINFTPMYFVLKNKSYPEVVIVDKHGQKYVHFLMTDVDSLGFPFWVILFPNYEDVITIYLKQFKLPTDMFFYTYENFKLETVRWKAQEKKQKASIQSQTNQLLKLTEEEKTTKIQEPKKDLFDKFILEAEKTIETSEKKEEVSKEQVKTEQEKNNKEKEETEPKLSKNIIDENALNQKILEEVKSEIKEIKYDPSSFLKFLEEAEETETQKTETTETLKIPQKSTETLKTEPNKSFPNKHKFELDLQIESEKKPPKIDEITIRIPSESKEEKNIQKIEKQEKTEKEEINLEKVLSKLETKIEKEKKPEINVISQEVSNEEGITIEIKTQLTAEDVEKLNNRKNEIIKKINELKFLKSIGEISDEEYEKNLNKLKKELEEIKEKIEKAKAG